MTDTDLLRASRDGDQFHYHWAARQALKLMRPDTDLKAITIEGVSSDDTTSTDGEEVIDLAEYYGSVRLEDADRVIYRQLKHSTVNVEEDWTVSGLKKTLIGFAEKFRQIRAEFPGVEKMVTFDFVSNRPVRPSVLRAIEDIATQRHPVRDTHDVNFVKRYLGFSDDDTDGEVVFCSRFTVDRRAPDLLALEHLFRQDLGALLPGAPGDEHVLVKEMVARRASSLEVDSVIQRSTVLAALRVTPNQLLPASNLIMRPDPVIATRQVHEIMNDLQQPVDQPFIIHAAGGIGKSVLATQICEGLPEGSVTLLYDCFGNGGYRRSSEPRHEHRQGLVQLSNELAASALCDPLVPALMARPADYLQVFIARVKAAADNLSARHPAALLVLVVDAADNAALIANDCGSRTFVTDLLREQFPVNVRLLMLCRTERVALLDPPPGAHRVELKGFGLSETKQHLETKFMTVTDEQAAEFHRRTGGNPRIQALVLNTTITIDGCLASLGEARDVDGTLFGGLLQNLVDKCKDVHRNAGSEIDRLCEALAALRPRIPVQVLSTLCGVAPALIHSFVADLGRPLLIDGETLQFRDEPAETWFRSKFRPSGPALVDFLDRLAPLADSEPYVALSLPQLLWEARRVDQLVELALTDGALPHGNDLERREIAQQRAQFALKATLRQGRDFEAARLALKAGALTAGHSRRLRLVRKNTDLAAQFLDPQTIEDLVATRSLSGDWPGSNLHYEGALLSGAPSQTDFARSRLRSATDWIYAWVKQPHEPNQYQIEADDIAVVAFGLLNTDGVETCIDYLSRWRPKVIVFQAGLIIATRLADAGRIDDLERLGWSAKRLKYLQFAIAYAASHANIICEPRLARRLVSMLKRHRRPISFERRDPSWDENRVLTAVTWIVAMGLRYDLIPRDEAERILKLCLPENLGNSAGSCYRRDTESLLRGFALLARTQRRPLAVDDIASADIVKAKERQNYTHTRELADYRDNVVPLAPWVELWVSAMTDTDADIDAKFQTLAVNTLKDYPDYETPYFLINAVARICASILAIDSSEDSRQRFLEWCRRAKRHIWRDTLVDVVRVAASREDMHHIVVDVAELVRASIEVGHEEAEYKSEAMVNLARATYRFDPNESRAYFTRAIDLTDRVGDDVYARWQALLALAVAASTDDVKDDRRAYRLAQIIEGLDPYVGDRGDHEGGLTAIARLSATTAIAVASRWRDRRMSNQRPLTRALATKDASPLTPTPVAALAMLPFDNNINALKLVERALRHAPADGHRIAQVIGEFERPVRHTTSSFDSLDRLAQELGIDLDGTLFGRGVCNVAPDRDFGPSTTRSRWSSDSSEVMAERERSAQKAISSCDFRTVEGWEAARCLLHDSELRIRSHDLIAQAVRVPLAGLDDMLNSFLKDPHFSAFNYATMLDELAALLSLPQAARVQIQNLAQMVATRFCRELTTLSYEPIDLRTLAQLAGRPEEDILGTALSELGSQPEPISSDECFALASRLARRLQVQHARVAFDDLAGMFLEVAPPNIGDGDFDNMPAPPSKVSECIAGYVWTALGDPDSTTRWRAAHCARLLVALGCDDELDALHRYALGTLDTTPFIDGRLPFYDKHALQWLLFGLARATIDPVSRRSVSIFGDLLKRVAFDDDPHVVMQASAKAILTTLTSSHVIDLTPDELSACESINVPIATIRQAWSTRRSTVGTAHTPTKIDANAGEVESFEEDDEQSIEFHFFMDFFDYWCRPAAKAFNIPAARVRRLVNQVIIERWAMSYRGNYDEDPRHTLKLYRQSGTHIYKSSWPKEDDLDFYLATHALWSVAGDLIRNYPVYHDLDADRNLFTEWLHDFTITRNDGRWLADRRDPPPKNSTPAGLTDSPDPDWIWRLSSRDFAERLMHEDDWVTVWETSTDSTYQSSQEVWIHSALATPDKARALVLAMQTAPSYMGFRVPDANDLDYQYSAKGFELTGWVIDQADREGQDSRDPLAASVNYPPPRPADRIVQLLGLLPDADMRIWSRGAEPAMQSLVWNDTKESSPNHTTGTHGHRLEMRRQDLIDMLVSTGRSLIVEVMIDRTHDDYERRYNGTWSNNDDDRFPFLERSFKVYLFDASGGCYEL